MGGCHRRRGVSPRTYSRQRPDVLALGAHQAGDERRSAALRQLR